MNIYDTLFLIIPWSVVFYIMFKDITSEKLDLFKDVNEK